MGNNKHIPSGTTLVIPIYAIHHSPNIFPDPACFRPERFLGEARKKIHKYAHIPFGAGPRKCIGYKLALAEAKLALIQLYQHFTFHLVSNDPLEIAPGVTYAPKHGVNVRVY